jgi:redox-sensitive bicupin YhaK (pirin superfamily)
MSQNNTTRQVIRIIEPYYVIEGAGVRLRRSLAPRTIDYLDPFLLFDHFGSTDPADYIAGFPMHPHRGIETVTYMLNGSVRHKDSLGNAGEISSGDVQWMNSGHGIMHEEMPQRTEGKLEGFQLWVNLPAKLKMSKPGYQGVLSSEITIVSPEPGVEVHLIAGSYDGKRGPVTDIAADPRYVDVRLEGLKHFSISVPSAHTVLAYLYFGSGKFGMQEIESTKMLVLGEGDTINVFSGNEGARFLLMSGMPIGEPIAPYGPFVMNTREEIEQALQDLRNGTFVYKD